jgi:hypothetical protein
VQVHSFSTLARDGVETSQLREGRLVLIKERDLREVLKGKYAWPKRVTMRFSWLRTRPSGGFF